MKWFFIFHNILLNFCSFNIIFLKSIILKACFAGFIKFLWLYDYQLLYFKLSVMYLTGLLICAYILELPLCEHMRVWATCLCWLHFICISFLVSIAPIEWATPCVHTLMGSQYICLQCGICIHELETWEGKRMW